MTDSGAVRIREAKSLTLDEVEALARVLVDCVDGGASVSFMHPLPRVAASNFWRRVSKDVEAGDRILIIAEDDTGIVGTVQVILAQPENQPHRGDISKMLVHRRARKRGVGEAMLKAAEAAARKAGKTLLVLDTASGDAERLYQRCGWVHAGTIPDYALLPHGGLCATQFYYRRIG